MERFKQFVKKILYKLLGEKRLNKLIKKRLKKKNPEKFEHYESFGELNPDKTIYVIRKPYSNGEGLLSRFVYVMSRIDFADRNGMIPFIDLDKENAPTQFNRFFRLRTLLTKEEVYQSKTVLLSGEGEKPVYPGWCNWINTEHNEQKHALFEKYIEFTDEVKNKVAMLRAKIQPEKCLGVFMRGTDYTSLKPGGHPIQPQLEDLTEKIDLFLEEEQLERIFLVTEDATIYNNVKARYGDKVVIIDESEFVSNYKSGQGVADAIQQSGDLDEANLLYLVKIILLSECNSFVGGRTNGSSVANGLNGGKYKKRFVYDVGYY